MPGDIVIGDSMGVAVVPRGCGPELLDRLRAREGPMKRYAEDVRAGVFSMDWVDSLLDQTGCPTDE